MATTKDDFVRLNTTLAGAVNFRLESLGLEWPPPERIVIAKGGKIRAATDDDDLYHVMVRTSMSQLDDEAASHPNVARGAEYRYVMNEENR